MNILKKTYNFFKKIKRKLEKKVILEKIDVSNSEISYEFRLKNFFYKKIDVLGISTKLSINLNYVLKRNRLSVIVPKRILPADDEDIVIKIYNNKKEMQVTDSEEYNFGNGNIIHSGQLYLSFVSNKNVIIKKHFSGYLVGQKIACTRMEWKDSSLKMKIKEDHLIEKDTEVVAINKGRVKILDTRKIRNSLEVEQISLLSTGMWQFFLKANKNLYPIQLSSKQEMNIELLNHQVEILSGNQNLYLYYLPYVISPQSMDFCIENGKISTNIQLDESYNDIDLELILEDNKTKQEFIYKLTKNKTSYSAKLPISEVTNHFTSKRFFLRSIGDKPRKAQFNLQNINMKKIKREFKEKINSQKTTLLFYKRKDKSLGLKINKPKIYKKIYDIKEFEIKGTVKGLEDFSKVIPYISFVERDTAKAIRVQIKQEFVIDLTKLNFSTIKSFDKTIIDIFIEIENCYGEVIRKEKIKYTKAKYRKDNYYDYYVEKDSAGNEHHYLITTTPFNNMKIETFIIPDIVNMPKEIKKEPNVWLIGERYNTAQDNGIVLFNWLQKNTKIDAYYVIQSNSLDYDRIKKNSNVLVFGSKRHYEIAFKAKVLLGTHDVENLLPYKAARGFFGYEDTIKVFLQHGILGRKNVEYHKKYYNNPFDLFIVSSDAEKKDVVVNKMGYTEDDVVVTGLARYDKLIQREKPANILLMPTWRDWINTDEMFLESEYYITYSNLINNEKLHSLLEEYDVYLNFYPHYRAQNYFQENMDKIESRIKFIPFGSKHVRELLIEHALLITDYSSVSFDVLRLKKPIIYYHFDVNRFFRQGILRPIHETFIGKTANTEEQLLELIEDQLKTNFKNYNVDISNVIKYQDFNNCERIYKSVLKKINELT